jgi:hypothetical protein
MHPSTEAILKYFDYGHLPDGMLRTTSKKFCQFAHDMADYLPEGPELTVCLRKLLEAKDCAVRAALDAV